MSSNLATIRRTRGINGLVHFFHHRIGIWYDGRQKWAPGFLDTTLHFLVLLLTVLFIVLYKDFALCSEGHSQFRFPFQEVLFAANGGYIGIASHGFALHCVWSLGSAFLGRGFVNQKSLAWVLLRCGWNGIIWK